jgi:DNA-binding transcriptional MerR regulator
MERYPIGWVEKNTGVSKETLRKWEERYGFPRPFRDERGNRLYIQDEIRLIAQIRHLTNQGTSPSKAIDAVLTGSEVGGKQKDSSAFSEKVFEALSGNKPEALQEAMLEELRLNGLANLVLEHLPDLNESVGEKWANGEISVYQEHLYSEVVQQVLRQVISETDNSPSPLFALLATPPGELHALGLLMVQSLLAIRDKKVISLGSQVPISELSKAVEKLSPFALGLSFSSAYPKRTIARFIGELRDAIQASTEIWIGGMGAQRAGKLPSGVRLFRSIPDFDSYLKKNDCRRD